MAPAGSAGLAGLPFYRYADEDVFRQLLAEAGFVDIAVQTLELRYRTTADELWDDILTATVRAATLVLSQPAPVQERIRAIFERKAAAFALATGLEIPFVVKVAAGRKPRDRATAAAC